MITVWEIVEEALSELDVPVAADAMIVESGEDYPDLYLVYFLVSSPPELHADNREVLRSYRMQVSIYSRLGLVELPDVVGAMLAADFIQGPMRPIAYNNKTRHFGLAMEFVLAEDQTEEISV